MKTKRFPRRGAVSGAADPYVSVQVKNSSGTVGYSVLFNAFLSDVSYTAVPDADGVHKGGRFTADGRTYDVSWDRYLSVFLYTGGMPENTVYGVQVNDWNGSLT